MDTVAAWTQRRPTLAAAVLYALMSVAMFAPALVPGRTLSASDFLWSSTPWEAQRPAKIPVTGSNAEQADAPSQFQPALLTTRAALPHIPLWDTSMLGGRPYVGDPQSSVFSPFSVPSYVLPFWRSLVVAAAIKLLVAALGGFLLGRELGLRIGGSLLTGLVFGFCLWSVSWVSWTLMSVWAFAPWLWLFIERCLRRPGPLPAAGLATVIGLQFLGGHPSSSFQIVTILVAFVALRRGQDLVRGPRRALRVLSLAAGLLGGAALAAVMLVPFGELLVHSGDLQERRDVVELFFQPPRYLLGIALHDYWGHGRTGQVFGGHLTEHAYYVGAMALILAAGALVARPRLERLAVALLAVVLLLISTGLTPLADLLVALPGFDASQNGRLALISVLCLAVLAGWGLDDLTAGVHGRVRRRLLVATCAGVALVPIVIAARRVDLDALGPSLRVAWTFAAPTRELAAGATGGVAAVLRLASVLEWLLPAALAVGLVALRLRGRLGVPAFTALALALAAADLLRAGIGVNPAIPVDHADQPTTPALQALQARTPARFVGLRSTAPGSFVLPLTPNVAMRYGLLDARGYVQPSERRHTTLWRRVISPSPDCYYFFCLVLADPTPRALRGLGVLGVGELLQSPRDRPLRGLRLLYDGRDARIYENPEALPRAFLADRQQLVAGADDALSAVTAPGFASRGVVVTERRLPGLAEAAGGETSAAPGAARIASYGRERVVVRTNASRASLLVLTDAAYPGWKASVDGRPAPIHRVDYLNRGVPVASGRHQVVFRYEPASWRIGWITSLTALAAIAAATLVGLRRRGRIR